MPLACWGYSLCIPRNRPPIFVLFVKSLINFSLPDGRGFKQGNLKKSFDASIYTPFAPTVQGVPFLEHPALLVIHCASSLPAFVTQF